MAIKTFTTGEVLTAADTNTYLANSGLVFVKSQALSSASNNITSAFNATYDNYLVVISGLNNSTTTTRSITMKMLLGTTATTDSLYTSNSVLQYAASTLSGSGVLGSTSFDMTAISNNANGAGNMTIEFFNPAQSVPTFINHKSFVFQSNIVNWIYRTGGGVHNSSSSYDGFQINGVTDNLSGTVTVYGYRKP